MAAAACAGCGGHGGAPRAGARSSPSAPATASRSSPSALRSAIVSGRVWLVQGRHGGRGGGRARGLVGVAVDLVTPAGVRSVATGAGGGYAIVAPVGEACTLEVPVRQDRLARARPVAGRPAGPRRSLATVVGDLDEIAVPPLAAGSRRRGQDFGFASAGG